MDPSRDRLSKTLSDGWFSGFCSLRSQVGSLEEMKEMKQKIQEANGQTTRFCVCVCFLVGVFLLFLAG